MREIAVLLFFLLFAIPAPLCAQDLQSLSPAERDGLLELLYRNLHSAGPAIPDPEFFVGQLPPDLQVALPLPNPSRLVGSIRRRDYVQVILDTSMDASGVEEFYRSALTPGGWQEINREAGRGTMGPQRGGFVAPSLSRGIIYCMSAEGPSLQIQPRQGSAGATAVYLSLHMDARIAFCREPSPGPYPDMPTLEIPEGTRVASMGGGGGGPGSRYTTASFEADLDLPELAGTFSVQLEQEGWMMVEETAGENTILSTWIREDESGRERQAILLTSRMRGGNQFFSLLGVHLGK